jgi:hypothetical protein
MQAEYNLLGGYSSFFHRLPSLGAWSSGFQFLRLHLNNNTRGIPQSDSYEFGKGVGIRHGCAKESRTPLFRQMCDNTSDGSLKAQVK